MNQRLERLELLHGCVRTPVRELIARIQQKFRRTMLVVWTFRSVQEQMIQFQKGRAWNAATDQWEVIDQDEVVTDAKPGRSAHNVITRAGAPAAMGVDLIPLFPDGSAEWTIEREWWDEVYVLAWKVGLDPLGDPIGSHKAGDLGHFEEPGWELKLDGLGLMMPA